MTSSDRLARFLPTVHTRERAVRGLPAGADVPGRIGPAEFSTLGAMVVVRCPRDLDPLMRKAGGLWGSRGGGGRWLDRAASRGAAGPGRHGPACSALGGTPESGLYADVLAGLEDGDATDAAPGAAGLPGQAGRVVGTGFCCAPAGAARERAGAAGQRHELSVGC